MAVNDGAPQGLSEREAEIYRLTVINRLTQDQIAARIGISQQRVGQILADARAKLPPPDLNAIRNEALELHLDVIRRAYALVEMNGAPVTAGKDGAVVLDPETGTVVRDYSGVMAALSLALKADEQRRKLLGLDAAARQEITGSVRYEVVGLPDIKCLT